MVKSKAFGTKVYEHNMPPLPAEFPLPPLPPIPVERLRDIALTHTSYYGLTKDTHDLDTAKYLQIHDYEKLEFLGDRILSLCVDMMVHEEYPGMRQGVASMIHDQLVRNDLLAQLADRYGLTEQIRASPSAAYTVKLQSKTLASIFESYIAGVFYAHLEGDDEINDGEQRGHDEEDLNQGVPSNAHQSSLVKPPPTSQDGPVDSDPVVSSDTGNKAVEPNPDQAMDDTKCDSISDPAEAASVAQPTSKRRRTYGDALDHTYQWLRPLFRPVLDLALDAKVNYQKQLEADKEEAERSEEVQREKEEETVAGGAAGALNIYCLNTFGAMPVYTCERAADDPRAWKVTCTVSTGEGETFTGEGIKPTKKMAKSIATHRVGVQMKLFK